jgi:hypothetical protein
VESSWSSAGNDQYVKDRTRVARQFDCDDDHNDRSDHDDDAAAYASTGVF